MLQDNEREEAIKAGMPAWQVPRNLAVDNEILVPVNKVVHVLVTSSDVIHNWTIPSFGSKVDAVPGRVTATWFKATKEGIYFGQCSELCGKDHAFMPIAVRVVKEQTFNDWAAALKAQRQEEGQGDHPRRGGRAARADQDRRRAAGRCDSRAGDRQRARPRGAIASGASADTKASDMATKAHADHGHGDDHAHTPTASGGGSIRPTTKTSARCTCCSPSWAG